MVTDLNALRHPQLATMGEEFLPGGQNDSACFIFKSVKDLQIICFFTIQKISNYPRFPMGARTSQAGRLKTAPAVQGSEKDAKAPVT